MTAPEPSRQDLPSRAGLPVSGEGVDRPEDGDFGVPSARPGETVEVGRSGVVGSESLEGFLELEFARLNRRSLASLLRQATGVVVPRAPYYGVLAGFPLPPQSVRLWRRRARAALRLVRGAKSVPSAADWISQLLVRPVERWPVASRLARSARRVEDSEFTRITQGYALLCEGEAGRAHNVFRGIEGCVRVLRHAWRVHEGLALSLELLGRHREALETMETAAEDPRRGVSAVAEGLRLSLLYGSRSLARRSAARLDMLVEERSPAFAAVLGRIRLRARILGLPCPRSAELADLVRSLAMEPGTPSGRVAVLLLCS